MFKTIHWILFNCIYPLVMCEKQLFRGTELSNHPLWWNASICTHTLGLSQTCHHAHTASTYFKDRTQQGPTLNTGVHYHPALDCLCRWVWTQTAGSLTMNRISLDEACGRGLIGRRQWLCAKMRSNRWIELGFNSGSGDRLAQEVEHPQLGFWIDITSL